MCLVSFIVCPPVNSSFPQVNDACPASFILPVLFSLAAGNTQYEMTVSIISTGRGYRPRPAFRKHRPDTKILICAVFMNNGQSKSPQRKIVESFTLPIIETYLIRLYYLHSISGPANMTCLHGYYRDIQNPSVFTVYMIAH